MNEIVKYEAESGRHIELTADDIRNVISTSPNVTDKEIRFFAELCASQHLDPFVKEVHLLKYGDNPATMVVGKDVFTKRAQRNPKFQGYDAGVTLWNDGKLEQRTGSLVGKNEHLVGGWCRVFIEGYKTPMFDEVSFNEYAGKKRDGTLNSQWANKPGTMIRKVAIVHALREAFPADLQGLYDESEMAESLPPEEPVEVEAVVEEVVTDEQKALGDAMREAEKRGIEVPDMKKAIFETFGYNLEELKDDFLADAIVMINEMGQLEEEDIPF